MWDFILPQEEDKEAFPVSTRSKNQLDPPQTTPKQKSTSSAAKDKVATKKRPLKRLNLARSNQIKQLHQKH